jgi:glutathione peroxidase-family protein
MRRICALLTVVLALTSCKNEQSVRITGEYPDGTQEILALDIFQLSERIPINSAKVKKNGTFSFTFELEDPELILLSNEKERDISLIVHPGDRIHVQIEDTLFNKNYAVTGSEESKKIQVLISRIAATRKKLDSITLSLGAYDDPEDPEVIELAQDYQQIINQQKKQSIRFVVENISSLASVYALYQRIDPDQYVFSDYRDLQYMKIVADSVKVKYPGSSLVKALMNEVDQREAQYRTIQALNKVTNVDVIESGSIDLAIQNTKNQVIRLSDLRGKVVLLNFWASGNAPSLEANRKLKPVYEKYKSRGFEVYSVSLDNNAGNWLSTIRFEEYPWIDVCELTYPQSYAASSYNVKTLPSNFLIDREGNILERDLGSQLLATWLDNLL